MFATFGYSITNATIAVTEIYCCLRHDMGIHHYCATRYIAYKIYAFTLRFHTKLRVLKPLYNAIEVIDELSRA